MVELRPYQTELLRRVHRALETDDNARVMMQLPTGGGKTVIAGELLSNWLGNDRKAVWLTHREELVRQTHAMLQEAGVRSTIDMRWRPTDPAPSRPGGVVVLMAQTVGRRTSRLSSMTWARYDANDLMIIDEAHHASAPGYVAAMEQWPGYVLGMTATPWRLSEREGFEHLFGSLVCGPDIVALQSEGALCQARVLVPPAGQRIRGGRPGQAGDYTEAGIARANEGPRRVMTAEAVNVWKEYAADRQTIAYAVSQDHARNLQAFFQDSGIPAEVILSGTEPEQRRAAIDGFKRGAVRALINVLVATEGFDLPDAACVMMARPTLSLSLYLQMAGRGLRPKSGGGDCLILDLAGNALTHGLPQARRYWSLKPRGKPAVGVAPAADDDDFRSGGKTCGRCGLLRGLNSWSFERHCGDAHDLVCDLCHNDAHIATHLPPFVSLTETAKHSDWPAPANERDALVALYHAAGGSNWLDNDAWLTDAPLAEWHGVSVDANGRVSGLELRGNQLQGGLPDELANLTNLQRLNLGFNRLAGEIPRVLGHLTNLQQLVLFGNRLAGEIPWELGRLSNLQQLVLFGNRLTGEIPWELGRLSNLQRLDLGENQLTGEIPRALGHLTNLQRLSLRENQLSGEIPWELGRLSNLQQYLVLSGNQLTGEIPRELGRLSNLQQLSLGENQLTGEIPWELGRLSNLQQLYLDDNQLTGEVPRWLGSLTNLDSLNLGYNQLTGEVPRWLGNLTSLDSLWLNGNQLIGEIPRELGRLSNLCWLRLDDNQLTGEIPRELGHLTNLCWLRLDGNQLTGEIPRELGHLTDLNLLDLSRNQLAGKIPHELGGLTNLRTLDVGSNRLTGGIPWNFSLLTNLTTLSLARNRLTVEMPWGLGTLRHLANMHSIHLSGNLRFAGYIPKELRAIKSNDLDELGLPFC